MRSPSFLVPSDLPEASGVLSIGFVAIALTMGLLFVAAVRHTAIQSGAERKLVARQTGLALLGAAAWLSVTGFAAHMGLLHFSSPPTMMLVFPLVAGGAVALTLSPLGRRFAMDLPMAALIGFHSFRIVMELLMHRAYSEGLMPVQMSFSGRNFDIVSGITALLVAVVLLIRGRRPVLELLWNLLGLGLLLNVVIIAILSAPTPMRVFMNEPSNNWVTDFPWVWLPTVMVFAALTGHLLVFRKLLSERGTMNRARQSDTRRS